jgi:hypothetical protein
MRWETTQRAHNDYKRLKDSEKKLFRVAVDEFNAACDRYIDTKGQSGGPAKLRVKPIEGARGVYEMTWSFSGPDGRATWEWTTTEVNGERAPAVRWRRIRDHSVFKEP